MANQNTLLLCSKKTELEKVEAFVDDICTQQNISPSKAFEIKLCLTEAVTNSIVHGNKECNDKCVKVDYTLNNNTLEFQIKDEGAGFNVNQVSDPTLPQNIDSPNGRGVYLINQLCQQVKYTNNGTTVNIEFNIT